MTEFERFIYNTYLRISRQVFNKPYKLRVDFSKVEGTEIEIATRYLSNLFTKHKHIRIDLFFTAPYKIYPLSSQYYFDYYVSQKAIKAYSIYINMLKYENPDDNDQLKFVIESYNFIKEFCIKQQIDISSYCDYNSGVVNDYIIHLKDFNVSVYSLFPFANFEKNLWTFDKNTLKFVLSDDYVDRFYCFRNKYLESKKCKTLSELAYRKQTHNT